MSLTTLSPLAGLLVLPLIALVWFPRGPSFGRPRPRPRLLPLRQRLLRTATLLLVALAAMQPALLIDTPSAIRLIVLDQRTSLSAAQRDEARAYAERLASAMPAGDDVRILQLGGIVRAIGKAPVTRIDEAQALSLSAALENTLARIPQGRRADVTLISDGLSADRHWARALAGFQSRGIAVNTQALSPAQRAAFVAGIALPAPGAGQDAEARIAVEGHGKGLTLTLYRGDSRLAGTGPFDVAGRRDIALRVPSGQAGYAELRAVLEGPGLHDERRAPLAVQDPVSVLYMGGRQTNGAASLQALLGKGFTVDDSAKPADFAAYRLVMLDDLPAQRLPADIQRRLLSGVDHGTTGLFVSGGEGAFAAGGYAATPLGDALPVTLRQEDKLEKPSVALAIVIDTSGSMSGRPLDLAKQVARFTVQGLTAQDSVGIVEFFGARQWSVPMQPARDIPDIERAIGRMQANGGSVLYPAIQEAYFGLKNSDARYKHILVISDAGVEEARYEGLLRHIAQDRVNVSTVLVGQDREGEDRMADWARFGQGRFYSVADETAIVQPRLNDPQQKPSPPYRRGRFVLNAPGGDGWWPDIARAAMPPLAGYALAGSRPGMQILLAAPDGAPVLATRPYGAGRITTFLSEPVGEGTRTWRDWPGYGAWLGHVLARTATADDALQLQLSRHFDRLVLTIAAKDPAGRHEVPSVTLTDTNGTMRSAQGQIEERAPGLFTLEMPYPANREARVEVRLGQRTARAALAPHSDVAAPGRMTQGDALDLPQLSARTGGRTGTTPQAIAVPILSGSGNEGTLEPYRLWLALLLIAIALYLGELLNRRWPTREAAAPRNRTP